MISFNRSNQRAFTLLEMLVVIFVVVLIIALAIPLVGFFANSALIHKDSTEIRNGYSAVCERVISESTPANTYFGLNADGTISNPNEDGTFRTMANAAAIRSDNVDISGQQIAPWDSGASAYYLWTGGRVYIKVESQNSLGNPTVLARIKDNFAIWNTTVDSNESAFEDSKGQQFLSNLATEGLDMKKMGAETWHYSPQGQGTLAWTDRSIADSAVGTAVPVIRYSYETETFTVWIANVTSTTCAESGDTHYNALSDSMTAYGSNAHQSDEDKTFANARALLKQAQAEYSNN